MKGDTIVCVTGNVATDLTSGLGKDGKPYVHFRMASTPRRLVDGQWVDGTTSFYRVVCFRSLAEHVKASVDKGHPVVVYGKQTVKEYTTDERTWITVEIEAFAIGHDLNRGTSMYRSSGRRRVETTAPDELHADSDGVVAAEPLGAGGEAAEAGATERAA